MARRSSSTATRIEGSFPIRVKINVPRHGLGRRLDDIYRWLRTELGEGRSGTAPAPMLGGDALGVHFLRLEDATRFLAAFPDLELAVPAPVRPPARPTGE